MYDAPTPARPVGRIGVPRAVPERTFSSRRASVVVVAVVAAVDLASKAWARAELPALGATNPDHVLRLGRVTNAGATLGLGADHPSLVALSSSVGVLALAVWVWRARQPEARIALSLALGGGLGNLVDRLARGGVTDWIHVAGYPATFNIADLAIRLGLLLLVIAAVRESRFAQRGHSG